MQDTNTEFNKNISKSAKSVKTSSQIKNFILNHILVGVVGFAFFFLFTVFIDYFLSLFDPQKSAKIDLFTLLIGLAGFLISFGFSYLENFKNKTK